MGCVLIALALGACGGAPRVPAGSSAGCDAARVAAAEAWTEVAGRCEAETRQDEPPPSALLTLHASLTERLATVRREGAADPEESLRVSGEMMDGIDEVELPEPLRERADFAAEALLAERGQGAIRATESALEVVEAILEHLHPGFGARRARVTALDELGRRARRAAEGYERGVAVGDRRADRAEAATLPTDDDATALREVTALRDRAREASRHARITCEVPRVLSVPSGM